MFFWVLINLLIIGWVIFYLVKGMSNNSYYYDQKEKKIVNFKAAKQRRKAAKTSTARKNIS